MANKKLIEVALPLEKINAESAREKSIRHGHPSTLHLWWARRPLAAARAVIWASLVDDPSSHPDLFPSTELQNAERKRLFGILEELVKWENLNNQQVLDSAKREIKKCCGDQAIRFLDPFAGGGAIPLEAQRLGLESHAHDLNPVAVMINKAMIDIPSRFLGVQPINPSDRSALNLEVKWNGATGLAKDVEYYGELIKDQAFLKIGGLYPKISVPISEGGGKADAVAWIWARTIKCPNPACGCRTPLAKTFNLSNKNKKAILTKVVDQHIEYCVTDWKGTNKYPGTVNRKGATCIACGTPISYQYIRQESKGGRLGVDMTAMIVERPKGRMYLSPQKEQSDTALIDKPDIELGSLAYYPGYINPVAYGLENIQDLFSARQITAIDTFSKLVKEIEPIIIKNAIQAGMKDDGTHLSEGGEGATAYAEAICVYLAFAVDRLADKLSTLCVWDTTRDGVGHTFGMTGMPMLWDYAEANPFSNSSGCFSNMIMWITSYLRNTPISDYSGIALQKDAQTDIGFRNTVISTDPPYYNNVPYADFADFFYVWMRRSIGYLYPELFSTMLTPKFEELVADQYRQGGKEEASQYFENGMYKTCCNLYNYSPDDIPVTIYYAYKQNEIKDNKSSSTGWETMLSAIIKAGFSITGTWPVRTELSNRMRANEANALASSIVLVCRKRRKNSSFTTRRNLINELRKELRPSLQKLQSSNIAPVDLAQSAIGPGMAVFSRYDKVLEADGSEMTVRSALEVINEELDLYFNEQVGDLDSMSRFCIDLYTQNAFNDISFGQADVLARAKGTSVDAIASHGPIFSKAGKVHLIDRDQLPDKIDHNENCIWMFAQQLTQLMATGGVDACAKAIYDMMGSNAEKAKDLAYRLYTIAEQKKWANEAYAYNALVVAWPDIQARAAELRAERPEQMNLFDY